MRPIFRRYRREREEAELVEDEEKEKEKERERERVRELEERESTGLRHEMKRKEGKPATLPLSITCLKRRFHALSPINEPG